MSPYEYVQEWIWRWSKTAGVTKFVFLGIGRRFRRTKGGDFITDALPEEDLVEATGMSRATVQRSIRTLETPPNGELEVVRSGRRGDANRYRLRRELKLPMMDADPAAQASHRGASGLTQRRDQQNKDAPQGEARHASEGGASGIRVSGEAARLSTCTESTSSSTSTTTPAESLDAALVRFLQGVQASYPTYNDGAQIRIDIAVDGPIGRKLLVGPPVRTVERLLALCVVMWTATPEESPFLANATHRGLHWFARVVDVCDSVLARREKAARAAASVRQYPQFATDDGEPLPAPNAWTVLVDTLASTVGQHTLRTWFEPCVLLDESETVLIVGVPNALFCEWLPKHYSQIVAETCPGKTVEYRVSTRLVTRDRKEAIG